MASLQKLVMMKSRISMLCPGLWSWCTSVHIRVLSFFSFFCVGDRGSSEAGQGYFLTIADVLSEDYS